MHLNDNEMTLRMVLHFWTSTLLRDGDPWCHDSISMHARLSCAVDCTFSERADVASLLFLSYAPCHSNWTFNHFGSSLNFMIYSSSSSSSSSPSTAVIAIRSRSLAPACVILLPPLPLPSSSSSTFSTIPSFSSACTTLRSTEPDASTW